MRPFTIEIDGFPRDRRAWRVDLFGGFDRNDNVPTDLYLEILMSPVIEDAARKYNILSNHVVDHRQQQSVWVNAGYLPAITIGSVWRDGTRDRTHYKRVESCFRSLTINNQTSRVIPAGTLVPEWGQRYLVPPYAYRLGARGLRTRLLSIDYGGVPHKILIPTVEVGRFYYLSSSQLTKKILWGKVGPRGERIYVPRVSKLRQNGRGYLKLRADIPDSDRWTVSRLAHSPLALRRAQRIYESLVKCRASGLPLVPDVMPPFDGETDLTAIGMWFRTGGEWRFFVTELRQCSHSFPCTELWWSRELDPPSAVSTDTTRAAGRTPTAPKAKPRSPVVGPLVSDTEPRARMRRVEARLDDLRFADLKTKVAYKVRGKGRAVRRVGRSTLAASGLRGYSTGDGTHGVSDAAPIAITNNVGRARDGTDLAHIALPRPRSFAFIDSALRHLSMLAAVDYRYLRVGDAAGDGYATLFPAPKSRRILWHYYGARRRQALVVEIVHGDAAFYLFETEHDRPEYYAMLFLYERSFARIGDDQVVRILALCIGNRGRWLRDGQLPHLERMKLPHTNISHERFAEKLLVHILAARGIQQPDHHLIHLHERSGSRESPHLSTHSLTGGQQRSASTDRPRGRSTF